MSEKNTPRPTQPEVIFLSVFGVGFFPWAPGTAGTLAVVPFLYLIGQLSPPFFIFIPLLVIGTFISSFASEHAQRKYDVKDPSWIVIDEVLGMITAWLFIQNHHWVHLLILFVLFRFFDIVKIWPASYFDKKVKHGAGVILDDIVSGIYAGLVYLLIVYFYPLQF